MNAPLANISPLTKISLFIFLLLLGAGGIGGALWYEALRESGPLIESRNVIVPKGANLELIGGRLEEAGVIRSKWVFVSAVRLQGVHRELRSGEYKFRPGVSIGHVIDLLRKGQLINRRVTIAEGLTVSQIIKTLEGTDGLEGALFPVPDEGSLLPDTYYFAFGEKRQTIVDRMALEMQRTLDALWAKRAPNLPITSKKEALILASIVEKETGLARERRRVAGVFINRLNKNMKLESDPTVVFSITGGKRKLGRGLRKSDLRQVHPYNTYRVHGLPPGPICNPGRAAIDAVLNPEKTSSLFFVADGSGGHKFSDTLREHNKAVREWRKIEQRRKANRKLKP
ncbi:MAG: aminodeoxychorismate lyase [Rhodospirillaceae bacterium]|nr:aminodeoxychorismate lyase [Rhodospirillaceae bacterium]